MAPEIRADFEDWHSHEHFPERLALPGFRRGSRWSSATGGEGIFVMYELEDPAALAALAEAELGDESLRAMGAAPGRISGLYTLCHSVVPADVV